MPENMIDVVLGVSVETDDDYKGLETLLNSLERFGNLPTINVGSKESTQVIDDIAAVNRNIIKETGSVSDDIKESDRSIRSDIYQTESNISRKIDFIWSNISADPRMLKGTIGAMSMAKTLEETPDAYIAKTFPNLKTNQMNVEGLTRIFGGGDVESGLKDMLSKAASLLKVLSENKQFRDIEDVMNKLSGLATPAGRLGTAATEAFMKTLYSDEHMIQFGLGFSRGELLTKKHLGGSNMDMFLENNEYSQISPKSGSKIPSKKNIFSTDRSMGAQLKILAQQETDPEAFKTAFQAKFNTSVEDMFMGKDLSGMLPTVVVDILGDQMKDYNVGNRTRPDIEMIVKGKLTEDQFRTQFRDLLEKNNTGGIDDNVFNSIVTAIVPGLTDQIAHHVIALSRFADFDKNKMDLSKLPEYAASVNLGIASNRAMEANPNIINVVPAKETMLNYYKEASKAYIGQEINAEGFVNTSEQILQSLPKNDDSIKNLTRLAENIQTLLKEMMRKP